MRQQSVAIGDIAERSFVAPAASLREVKFAPADTLPITDLVEMYINIEASLGNRSHLAIQLASGATGFGAEQVGLDLAWAGSSVLGKHVLLLTGVMPPLGPEIPHDKRSSVHSFHISGWNHDLVKIAGQDIYLGNLGNWRKPSGAVISASEIDRNLDDLSLSFDMIIVAPPPITHDPLGMVMARHVDGNVVVIEAEATRRHTAVRLREMLVRSGRPIIGAVMTGQRNYLPRWLTSVL